MLNELDKWNPEDSNAADPVDGALAISETYLALPTQERIAVLEQYNADRLRRFGIFVSRCCARAIDEQDARFIWPAIMALEISAASTDWRQQLVRLLVVDHTIQRLKAKGIDFDFSRWNLCSAGTLKTYRQLDNRHPDLRNIESVDLGEVIIDGKTVFKQIVD